MKKGYDFFLSQNKNNFLIFIMLMIIGMTFFNALYHLLGYEFGGKAATFLKGPDNRFADLIEVALSFKTVTAKIIGTPQFQNWAAVYKGYYLHNAYGGIEALNGGHLTHFHHPPFSQLLFTLCGLLLASILNPKIVIWMWFGLYLLAISWFITISVEEKWKNTLLILSILFLCLLSYPALFIFGRANYNAGFTSLLISTFLLCCFGRKNLSFACLLSLAVAINIRPNAIIFLAAIPLSVGFKASIKPVLQAFFITGMIFFGSLMLEHWLDPDYTLQHFFQGVAIYKEVYVINNNGNVFNSSLYALIKNLSIMKHSIWSYHQVIQLFVLLSVCLFVCLSAVWLLFDRDKLLFCPFILVSLYALLTPVFSDYHLLVFMAPLCLIYMNYKEWMLHPFAFIVVSLACILVLAPKNYESIRGLSLQTIYNPAILISAILLVTIISAWGYKKSKKVLISVDLCNADHRLQ